MSHLQNCYSNEGPLHHGVSFHPSLLLRGATHEKCQQIVAVSAYYVHQLLAHLHTYFKKYISIGCIILAIIPNKFICNIQ